MKPKGLGARLRQLFGIDTSKESFYEELEDLLVEADFGADSAVKVVEELRTRAKSSRLSSKGDLAAALKQILHAYLRAEPPEFRPDALNAYLVLGVNGTGKTTTIAKLAEYFRKTQGTDRIVLVAGDTFRAAAIDQLRLHAERLSMRIVSQAHGADPSAVIYDGITSAKNRDDRLVLIDTAGRMHNRQDLVRELEKIDRVVRGRLDAGVYQKLLIIDATTGQNGLRQAEIFHEAVGIDRVILTKYDSTAKGGIAVAISRTLGLPFAFIGSGETYADIIPFDVDAYLDSLLDIG